MRRKGKKYILRESELKHVIRLCALNEDGAQQTAIAAKQNAVTQKATARRAMSALGNTGTTVQQAPQGNGELAQLAALPPEQKVQKAKQEASQLMHGQGNPKDPEIREFLYMVFGGTDFWGMLSNMFGWDSDEVNGNGGGNGYVGEPGQPYNGPGGGPVKVVSMPFAEWKQGPGKDHVASQLTNYVMTTRNCGKRRNKISKITIHHMASVGSALEVGKQFQQPARQASANYGIGNDGQIVLYVPEDLAAWTSSNSWNDAQAITIEASNSASSKGQKPDFNNPNTPGGQIWPVGAAALRSLIALCRDICSRYGIVPTYTGKPDGTFTEHRMYASTTCPGPYLHFLLAGKNGREGELISAIKGNVPQTAQGVAQV